MVKIFAKDGREEKFDSKDVEKDLKAAGLPERVAEEVAERVEDKVQDGWTTDQVKQETDLELKRLQEDIDRAHNSYRGTTPMGSYNTGTQRSETKVECRNVE
jgi:hypothetical protein